MTGKIPGLAALCVMTAALSSCGRIVSIMDNTTNADPVVSATITDYIPEEVTEPATEPFSLDVSVPANYKLPDAFIIEDFETVLQNPELPTGCEVTALTQTLNFLGFDIDKVELADEFMPIDFNGDVTMALAYIGDPKANNGFGCNAPVIVRTADDYFEAIDSPCYAEDISDTDFLDLFYQIEQGRPVIIWTTMELKEAAPKYQWTATNGEEMWFINYQHCMTLYGYDLNEGIVYAADPLIGNTTYPLDRFEMIYELMGRQAVVICGDSETEGSYTPIADKLQTPMKSRNHKEEETTE